MKGCGGGIWLVKEVNLINIGEVFRLIVEDVVLVECFVLLMNKCVILLICCLKIIF